MYRNPASAPQLTPTRIPRFEQRADPVGRIGCLNVNGPTRTRGNAFVQQLGSNQRTGFTCHQP